MKKFVSIVIALTMIFALASFAEAADYSLAVKDSVVLVVGNTNAIAHNSIVQLPVAPVIENDRMLVPVRFVASEFGADVQWDGSRKLVTLTFAEGRTVEMIIGDKNISVNGQIYETDAAPVIMDGYTMLPVSFLAKTALGKSVFYDDSSKMALISTRKVLTTNDTDVIAQITNAITTGVLPEIVITAPVPQGGMSSGGAGAETGKLTIASVNADQEPEPDNGAAQMIDGSTGTRWASQGSATATCDLGSAKPVTHIRVAVWKPTERNTNYGLAVSSDGAKWTSIFDGASSGSTWDSYDVNDTIRYVKITPNGTSAGDWASILELEVWNGTAAVSAGSGTITPVSVSADQTPEAENVAANVFDGDTETKWACQGTGTLTVDLGSAKQVSTIELNFWKYAERTTNYQLQVSADGSSYQSVFSGSSTLGQEYDVRTVNQSIRYIKFIGTGTSQGEWTSLNEMVIKGGSGGTTTTATATTTAGGNGTEVTSPTGTKATITSSNITVSQEPEADNNKANLIDGDKQTVWASQNDADAIFDLGSAKTVSTVGVAMKMYEDERTIPYDIYISTDGTTYTQVWSGSSEPSTNTTKYVSIGSSARYVKITAHGNTVSGWNSVAEVEIYTN